MTAVQLKKDVVGRAAQSLDHLEELDHIDPALTVLNLTYPRLRPAKPGSQSDLGQAGGVALACEDLPKQLMAR